MVKENLALKSLAWNGPGTRSYQKTARNVTMFVELILALALITNFEAISFESASRQIFDTSCGFSSVTALMSLYEDDIDELSLIFEVYGGNERSNFNVSLMDLFHLLNNHGYYSAGFKMTYEELAQAVEKYYPLVIHLEEGNGHFLLVLGILDDVVVIMDPAEGVRTIHRNELEATWSNVVFEPLHAHRGRPSLQRTGASCGRMDLRKNRYHPGKQRGAGRRFHWCPDKKPALCRNLGDEVKRKSQ